MCICKALVNCCLSIHTFARALLYLLLTQQLDKAETTYSFRSVSLCLFLCSFVTTAFVSFRDQWRMFFV